MNDSTRRISVEQLCSFAGIEYGVLDGPKRLVRLARGGGHQKSPVPGRQRADLIVDRNLIHAPTKRDRAIRVLEVLAVDLDCYEAGESLLLAGLVETLPNGRFARRELVRTQ